MMRYLFRDPYANVRVRSLLTFVCVCVLALPLLAASCEKPSTASIEFISEVQRDAVIACGYVPLAATVSAIFANSSVTSAISIASQICAAVKKPQSLALVSPESPPPSAPKVGGVKIEGYFIKPK